LKENDTSIIILAAGKGSRMKSSKAKVLHNVCGKPMLYHIIKASKQISDDVTVVIAHQEELVREEIEHYFDDIKFVIQDHENYPGTGGALKNVEFRHENVLVLNGDMPLVDAVALEQFFKPDGDIVMSIEEIFLCNFLKQAGEYREIRTVILECKFKMIADCFSGPVSCRVYVVGCTILNLRSVSPR